MTRHADSPRPAEAPPAPEPAYAERARTLLYLAHTGTLATISRKHPGHPFASVMPYALDPSGHPLFLISALAVHTQNLQADPRASLLVTQPGHAGDPLASGRVTLMGKATPIEVKEAADVRSIYLARHRDAGYWVDFGDFGFWRLRVSDVYFVGGFGTMGWVEARDYSTARPDPLADAAEDIMDHMNRDHPDALLTYARVLGGVDADEATMVAVDRLGFKLRLRSGERRHSARIAFPREVRTAAESRAVLIAMLRDARAAGSPRVEKARETP